MKVSELNNVAMLIYALLWNVFLVCACSYLVFWRDASAWWFLLLILGVSIEWKSGDSDE